MSETTMECPFCGGVIPDSTAICPFCDEDVSGLARLEYGHVIYYNAALASAREGDLDDARTKLTVALELKESFVPAHLLLAKVCARQERWAEAEASVIRALELAPEDPDVLELAEEIKRVAQEKEQAAAQSRRAKAERVLDTHERDLMRAFGLGAGLVAFLATIFSWIGGRKEQDSN